MLIDEAESKELAIEVLLMLLKMSKSNNKSFGISFLIKLLTI